MDQMETILLTAREQGASDIHSAYLASDPMFLRPLTELTNKRSYIVSLGPREGLGVLRFLPSTTLN